MNDLPKLFPAHVLVIDDDPDILRLLSMRLRAWDIRVSTALSAEEGLSRIAVEQPQLVISDIRLPGKDGLTFFREVHASLPSLPVILLTAHGTIPDAVQAMSEGVFGYLTKPFDSKLLFEKVQQALRISPTARHAEGGTDGSWHAGLVFRSQRMAELMEEARVVAATDASILIRGESGTGKEVLARAIHRASPRSKAPFVAINCGAIPEQLLESELFGHVRGAFTGATSEHTGLFKAADGGTLFLDEIGDMSLGMQTKLLRALQERSITRIGSETPTAVNIRLLCATHRDLKEMVGSGEFREDLYYRINVVQLRVPPLRERREDILWLSRLFLAEFTGHGQKPPVLTAAAEQALMAYPWPGNIRELRNTLERACLLSDSRSIGVDHLFDQPVAATEPQSTGGNLRDYLNEREREFIVRALDTSQWQIQACADTLGISRKTLWEKMRRLGIDKEDIDGVM